MRLQKAFSGLFKLVEDVQSHCESLVSARKALAHATNEGDVVEGFQQTLRRGVWAAVGHAGTRGQQEGKCQNTLTAHVNVQFRQFSLQRKYAFAVFGFLFRPTYKAVITVTISYSEIDFGS